MPEHSDADDFIPRTVAREAVCIASHSDDVVEAESYLIEHMSKLPPDGWRSRPWGAKIVAAVEGARVDRSFVVGSARAMQVRLWKEANAPRGGAIIHVRGNEAVYRGPLFAPMPVGYEIRRLPKGFILIPDSLILIDPRQQAEIRVGAISLRLGPLLEALRRDFGGLADRAIDQLRKQGLLPASTSPSSPRAEAPAVTEVTETRVDDEPQRDERRSRKRGHYAGTMSTRALKVLKRIYPDQSFPTRDEVTDPDLWDLFCEEWAKVEGAKGHPLKDRPSKPTVMRVVGRKDYM